MHPITKLIPIAVLAVGLAGCGSPKPIKYYAVQIPAAPSTAAATYPIDVRVGKIIGPSLLQSAPIIYKTSANEIGVYKYHRWQDPPVDLVQSKLLYMLRSSGTYQSVTDSATSDAEYIIRGRLHEFAELDKDGINGVITMEFELYNRKTAKILWTHFYSQIEPSQGKDVAGVAQALDRNLDRGLKEVMAGLGQYFASHPPTKSSSE
jgi:ABC-type uncharacterized transport system auxiliary subunit